MEDLFSIIEDSLTDSTITPEPEETTEQVELAPETPTETPEAPETPQESIQVDSPPDEPEKKLTKAEAFEKLVGVPPQYPGGRENRIPYSRVKKITEKAVSDAKKEWETQSTPRTTEYETKVKDYESKLEQVAKFEQVMINDPEKFLNMLATVPAYKGWFDEIRSAFAVKYNSNQPIPQSTPQPGALAPQADDMPQPDQPLSDGSMVYSLDGLKALLKWQSDQTESRVTKRVEERYKPIESEWQANKRVQEMIPHVRAQIDDARTWPLFNDNEAEITQVLQADSRISLEGAYRKVVWPKMVSDRNKMRDELLKEVKQAPRATSATTGMAKVVQESVGPRNLEDIIAEQIKTIK